LGVAVLFVGFGRGVVFARVGQETKVLEGGVASTSRNGGDSEEGGGESLHLILLIIDQFLKHY